MNGQATNDDVLLIVFLLWAAFMGILYLVDLFGESSFRAVWRTVYGDWLVRRKAIRAARLGGDRSEVLTRLRIAVKR